MKTKQIFLLTAAFMALSACGPEQETAEKFETFTINRGTNIAHWLSQSDRRGAEREAFFTREDMQQIAELGFDHVRIPIDEEQMWDEERNRHPEAFDLLHNAIRWADEFSLRVIVDLHILRSHHFNQGTRPLWTDPAEQEWFIEIWRQLSGELGDYPLGQVAYELMNEAVTDDPAQWNGLVSRTHAAIRELEPERTIVIGSNRWQSPETFPDLVIPENDTNIVLSFHFYTPFALTHHQASWTGIHAYEGPVTYPGEVIAPEDLEDLPEDLREQLKWAAGYYTADTLEQRMQLPIEYARERGLKLFCGEFGVYSPAPREPTLIWYDDMINILEENDIAWANWCYKGSFGIFNDDGSIDRALMDIFFQHTASTQ